MNSHPLVTTVLDTPQMYQHACSPSRLGARYLRIVSLAHYAHSPEGYCSAQATLPIPTNSETNYQYDVVMYRYRLFG